MPGVIVAAAVLALPVAIGYLGLAWRVTRGDA
jgi:hypothetical protein